MAPTGVLAAEERPDVSVVIPAYNAQATLATQLGALASQTYTGRFEVIVSDNGSTDSTVAVVTSFAPRLDVRVVDSSDRRGAGHARNVGTAAATGEIVAYCDADDVADAGWLSGLMAALEPGYADIVGGALEHHQLNDPETDWRGNDGSNGLPRPMDFLPFAISANCATRVDVWRAIGGWREDYEHGGDDVDFSWRAQLAGYRMAFASSAVMHYRRRSSLRGLAHQVFDYSQASVRLYVEYKDAGARRRPARQVARSIIYPISRLPYLAMSRYRRGLWLSVAVSNYGHVTGSWRNRTLYL